MNKKLSMLGLWLVLATAQQGSDAKPPPLPSAGVRLYLGAYNSTVPNFAMVSGGDFYGGTASGPGGLHNGLWCQSAIKNASDEVGGWLYPNGTGVPANSNARPVSMEHSPGQVGLVRKATLIGNEGFYTCIIPDEDGVNRTLVVWAAGVAAYEGTPHKPVPNPTITAEMKFHLPMQPRSMDPPEFLLAFGVGVAPPTYVRCQVNGSPLDVALLSREVTSGVYHASGGSIVSTPVTNVTVTLRSRQAGNYQCTVSVYRTSGTNLNEVNTLSTSVSVTDIPTNMNVVRTDYKTVELSWSSPTSNTPTVAGYEVFYTESASGTMQSGAVTASSVTSAALSVGLELGNTYSFFVVAYSNERNTLPSAHSEKTMVELSIPQLNKPLNISFITATAITLSWSAPEFLPTHYNLTGGCRLLCDTRTAPLHIMEFTVEPNRTSANITGFLPGSECNFSLTASYGMVNSNVLTANLPMSLQNAFGAFSNFAISSSVTNITLTWKVPLDNMWYHILYTYNATDNSAYKCTAESMFELTGLSPSTSVKVTITAFTGCGAVAQMSGIQSTAAISVVLGFDIERIDSTTVIASWASVNSTYTDCYTVYYTTNSVEGSRKAHSEEPAKKVFPAKNSSGVIEGLEAGKKYLFWLTVTYNISGTTYEGEGSDSIEYDLSPPLPTTQNTITTTETATSSTDESDVQLADIFYLMIFAAVVLGFCAVIITVLVGVIIVLKAVRRKRRRNDTRAISLDNKLCVDDCPAYGQCNNLHQENIYDTVT